MKAKSRRDAVWKQVGAYKMKREYLRRHVS